MFTSNPKPLKGLNEDEQLQQTTIPNSIYKYNLHGY